MQLLLLSRHLISECHCSIALLSQQYHFLIVTSRIEPLLVVHESLCKTHSSLEASNSSLR